MKGPSAGLECGCVGWLPAGSAGSVTLSFCDFVLIKSLFACSFDMFDTRRETGVSLINQESQSQRKKCLKLYSGGR